MASTAATVFATTPTLGIDLDSKASTPAFATNTIVWGNDGRQHLYARASEALSSTQTILIGTSGSASSDSGSAGWTCNTSGGVTAGQYFFGKKTAL